MRDWWRKKCRGGGGSIELTRLIDFAHSTDCCVLAEDAMTDFHLGKFLVENDFVEEISGMTDSMLVLLDYRKIGREHREEPGRRRAIKSLELEATMNVSGNELRRQVNRLRRQKVPVCSGTEGYFYARSAGEIYATINGLKDMMYGLAQAIDGLEAALEDFGEKQDGAGTDS